MPVIVDGTYTEQVHPFRIVDDGAGLSVVPLSPLPAQPDANYRRRDLNVIDNHAVRNSAGQLTLQRDPM